MKLYIKQRVFSWRDRFYIKDEAGEDKYCAEGEFFSWGRKLHIFDVRGSETAFISQKLMSFLPRYNIEIDGESYTLVKEFTFFTNKFRVDGTNLTVDGDFLEHEYSIFDGQSVVMRMSKHWFTWGDSYEMDIPDPADERLCLCIALGIDCINADTNR